MVNDDDRKATAAEKCSRIAQSTKMQILGREEHYRREAD